MLFIGPMSTNIGQTLFCPKTQYRVNIVHYRCSANVDHCIGLLTSSHQSSSFGIWMRACRRSTMMYHRPMWNQSMYTLNIIDSYYCHIYIWYSYSKPKQTKDLKNIDLSIDQCRSAMSSSCLGSHLPPDHSLDEFIDSWNFWQGSCKNSMTFHAFSMDQIM